MYEAYRILKTFRPEFMHYIEINLISYDKLYGYIKIIYNNIQIGIYFYDILILKICS